MKRWEQNLKRVGGAGLYIYILYILDYHHDGASCDFLTSGADCSYGCSG